MAQLNVLIVEDDSDIGKMLKITLQDLDIDATHAKNGELAIQYLEENHPDLILLDLNLPIINGWKVLEFAKERYGKTFHVIVITANADGVNRLVGKMQDVTHYIQKPFIPNELVELVSSLLELNNS